MGRDGSHYHDKGEKDASEGKYDPPGSWVNDLFPSKIEKDRDDYNKGWRKGKDDQED